MDVRACLGEGAVRIWMRDVFASEDGDMAVCAVDVFFYGGDGAVSRDVSSVASGNSVGVARLTDSHLLLFPPFPLFECTLFVDHALPPSTLEPDVFVS